MELPREKNSLTPSQQRAVAARGNVLVMAGAGTGKTKTLVERCLDCLERDGAAVEELLIVTFTEAAAAEMRERLRRAMEAKTQDAVRDVQPAILKFWQEQLACFDLAHIGTLHSFCFKLVREHFYELGLDPRLTILAEGETRQLANETLDEQFAAHYAGGDDFSQAVQNLILVQGGGRDESLRKLVLRLHDYSQARPDAVGWLAQQREKFSVREPAEWQGWLLAAIADWRAEWLPVLENLSAGNEKAAELAGVLSRLGSAGVPPAKSGVAPDFLSSHRFQRDAENGKPEACAPQISRETAAEALEQMVSADGNWPAKRKTVLRKPLEDLFDEAKFLFDLAAVKNGADPLAEDWSWVRDHLETLLRLAEEFARNFADRKRADGVLDFHDLEQFALKLLWDFSRGQPTAIAASWREKLKFVFVDEYQDINAAQDKIIAGLSRSAPVPGAATTPVRTTLENSKDFRPFNIAAPADGRAPAGNRFLVGDVKQSIYRFRLADPQIFRDYAQTWRDESGQTIPLSENFRSRESLLDFVNSVFRLLLRGEIGGVGYGPDAELKFGSPETRGSLSAGNDRAPRAELLLRFKTARNGGPDGEDSELAGLDDAQREARLVAWRLKQLVAGKSEIFDGATKNFRAVEWRDIAVLLRSPRGKAEIFANEFQNAKIPLDVAPGGFYQSAEILDLLSLLQLLDNPLQDVPCIAVLRSPLGGLSLDELAEIRLAAKEKHFWTALVRSQRAEVGGQRSEFAAKISQFLERFSRWRKLVKQVSLSQCLDEILAETFYADWLRAQPRGRQRAANVTAFLRLAQQFDQFQRQGLFRFLNFIAAQQEVEAEPEVPPTPTSNAVRLMSIHQSKGQEFPVVVLADLAKNFNEQDLRGEIIFDERFGLCPKVKPPHTGRRYSSLPHWLAQRRQRRELRGEELRLLYVALTRARDNLILTASITEKNWDENWTQPKPVAVQGIAGARGSADWLALWFSVQSSKFKVQGRAAGDFENLRWQIVADAELSGSSRGLPRQSEAVAGDEAQIEIENEFAPAHVGSDEIGTLRARLEWKYPFRPATTRRAKSSVTALRREAEELDDEAEPMFPFRAAPAARDLKSQNGNSKLSAAEMGAAHHKFLQHVALEKIGALAAEADRLARENYLSAAERAALDLPALAAFWNSPLGQKIVARAAQVRRELPFTARFSPAEIAALTGVPATPGLDGEFVVVQGVADLAVLLPAEIWLVDFKTDHAGKNALPEKIKIYKPQLQLYAAALEKIFARKVTLRALHFLAARRTVEL